MSAWRLAGILALAAGLAGQPATAATVTWTFQATVTAGPLAGQSGTGSFSYEEPSSSGTVTLTPADGLTVSFAFDGQAFDQANDVDAPDYPQLNLDAGVPLFLDFVLEEGFSGVDFANPLIRLMELGDLAAAGGGAYDLTTDLLVQTVPLPATLPLLATALAVAGLGFGRGRRK